MKANHILVVDDEPDIRTMLREIFEDEGYTVSIAENGAAARQMRRAHRPDLILLDIWMPDIDGISLLKEWVGEEGEVAPVIMISGHGTVETAIEAVREGAWDFIEKPLSLGKLLVTVERALESTRLQQENRGLRRLAQVVHEPIGRSEAMQQLRAQAQQIAQSDATVLLRGEPGSGRETVARYIHQQGGRSDGPFVDLHAASLVGEAGAEELFGLEQGERLHYGLLEQAAGGTLYIDDIAELELPLQARLLTALESRTCRRAGGADMVPVNVRVIAATRHDLEQAVADGRLRPDLFYHLNIVPLAVPALREHSEDVPELLEHYTGQLATGEKLTWRPFSTAAQNRLRQHGWPGNIRELRNLVQRLLVTGREGTIEIDEVEAALGGPAAVTAPTTGAGADLLAAYRQPLREAREWFERGYFEHHLRETGGNVGQVAQLAGVERTHLYRKLRGLGLDPKQLKP